MYTNVERSVLVKYSLKDTLPRLVMCCIHLLIQVAGYEFVFIFSTLFCFLYFLTSTSIPHVLTHAHAHKVNILSFENAQKKSIFGGWRGVLLAIIPEIQIQVIHNTEFHSLVKDQVSVEIQLLHPLKVCFLGYRGDASGFLETNMCF